MVQEKANAKLKITEFGNPILRKKAKPLSQKEIKSAKLAKLIADMEKILFDKKHGIGLAAPQIGIGRSLAIIRIRPKKYRKNVKNMDLDIINPRVIETYGRKKQMWEGCISGGSTRSGLFAKVPRYNKIKLEYRDKAGVKKEEIFEGLPAQVIQHEFDHLQGVLFVDKVKDTKSYISYREYIKLTRKPKNSTSSSLKDRQKQS